MTNPFNNHQTTLTNPTIWAKFKTSSDSVTDKARQWSDLGPMIICKKQFDALMMMQWLKVHQYEPVVFLSVFVVVFFFQRLFIKYWGEKRVENKLKQWRNTQSQIVPQGIPSPQIWPGKRSDPLKLNYHHDYITPLLIALKCDGSALMVFPLGSRIEVLI